MKVEKHLQEMGIELPKVPIPVAAYTPGVQCGKWVYTSGQLPSANGQVKTGKLGQDLSTEDGYAAARISALNCLAVLKELIKDLDRIERVVKVVGFVNSTPDYLEQAKVVNGASELLKDVFGESGVHSRSAVGVASLPLGACCEVEMIVKLKEE